MGIITAQTSLKDLGKQLIELREKKGFSKNQLAKSSRLSMRQIINIENGGGYNVSSLSRYLFALGHTLNISIEN
jgi:transcriptional regulator with XRE-family HTH domain